MSTEARALLQRRAVGVLSLSQILGGVGMASGIAVGSLLAEDLSGSSTFAGLGSTFQVLGGALVAIPVARTMVTRGRRVGLELGYGLALVGAALIIAAGAVRSFPMLLIGSLLFGGGTAAGGQARYAAVDLAAAEHRGRDLSIVVWATTIGSVLGPNLVGPGKVVAHRLGIPELTGSFAFSLLGFGLAFAVVHRLLRPDPLLTARLLDPPPTPADAPPPAARHTNEVRLRPGGTGPEQVTRAEPLDGVGPGFGAAPLVTTPVAGRHDRTLVRGVQAILARRRALLGLLTTGLGHAVMVSVMVMTPLHMRHGQAQLEVIGLVISVHVLGMFALSPLVGIAVDRLGGRGVAAVGGAILAGAALLASRTPTGWSVGLLVALLLLGLGWSCTLVSGSTMLTETLEVQWRPAAQGVSEVFMGLAGAGGGALAGVVVARAGYGTLTTGSAVLAGLIALLAAVLRPR